jgi:hypothetical protein
MTGSAALEGCAARAVALRGSVARTERQRNPGSVFPLASRSRISRTVIGPATPGRTRSGRTRWFHPGHERKGGGTPADAYLQPPHPQPSSFPLAGGGQRRGRGARPAGRARLSAFHRGSCLGDPTPPLSSGYALPGTQPWRVLPALSLSQSSELLRRPVIVPAGRIPEAARE